MAHEKIMARCHPQEPNHARGYCAQCYSKAFNQGWADQRVRREYGVSADRIFALLEVQEYECAICSNPVDERNGCIDHNHVSGSVRGILCKTCNLGLGHFRDSRELLEKAAKYLHDRRLYAAV